MCGTTALAQSQEPRTLTAIALSNFLHGHFPERPFPHRHKISGVVDQDVHSAELLHRLLDHRLDALLVGDVASHADRSATHVFDRLHDTISAGNIGQRQLRTLFRESHRIGFGDFSAAASNDDGLVFEAHLKLLTLDF